MDVSGEDSGRRKRETFLATAVALNQPGARAVQEGDMTQRALAQRDGAGEFEEPDPEIPQDADRFAVGLEDDRKLHKVWLIAGLLSEAALVGMFVTALEEPGRDWPVVLAILVVGLGLAMAVHLARCRLSGKPRAGSEMRHRSMLAR